MKNGKGRVIFLKGRKVILRPPRKETDLENAVRWINDQEVSQCMVQHLPISAIAEERWFDEIDKDYGNIHLAIETLRGGHIGFMGLHRINWRVGHAVSGAMIGEKKYWGKGYGTDAKMLLLHYAFHTLNLRKVKSAAIAYNRRSIEYNIHCGYKEIGRRQDEFFRHGKYWDEVLLEVFREEWAPLWEKYQRGESLSRKKRRG